MNKKVEKAKYISQGSRNNVDKNLLKSVKRERPYYEKYLNKVDAWLKGKNPWITIELTDVTKNSNMRYKRVKANELWGKP